MTGPPPRLPFDAGGFRWRVLVSVLIVAAWVVVTLVHFALWAGSLDAFTNLALGSASVAAVVVLLALTWASWTRRFAHAR